MEVKDIRPPDADKTAGPIQSTKKSSEGGEAFATDSVSEEASNIDVTVRSRSLEATNVRREANEIISIINVAADATAEIERLVQSIGGIAEQAKNESLSPQRRAVLEQEANELVDEIKKTAERSQSNGVRPLAGDKIRLEVEERIGKTLEIILPEDAREGLGLGLVQLSTKDSIINTITSIATAEERLNKLRQAVQSSESQVKEIVQTIEVAQQNRDSSEASIRDLDEALRIAGDTKFGIGNNPQKALDSVGTLDSSILELLE